MNLMLSLKLVLWIYLWKLHFKLKNAKITRANL
nr:MAG TPA: hypothetical protein [Bacteriophage sp.]